MSTRFADRFAAGRRKIRDKLGETVTYNPLGVAGSEITAVLTSETAITEHLEDGKWRTRRCVATCQSSDVSTPSSSDTVTIDGETWQVDDEDQVEETRAGFVDLPLVLKTRIEVSGPEHRLKR